MTASRRRVRNLRKGFVLLTAAAGALAMLGMTGLCLDLARLYILKNELQSFADAASIAAANRLDGTAEGIAAATAEAGNNVNRWNFGQDAVPTVQVEFSASLAGWFTSNPIAPLGYKFARVQVHGNVTIYFLPILSGVGASYPLQAESVAGQQLLSGLSDGAFPFSPDAHVPNPLPEDPTGNFGFTKGKLYTLRWDPVGKGQKIGIPNTKGNMVVGCDGDMTEPGFVPGMDNNGQRGYIDLQQGGGGAAFIREAILGGVDVDPIQVGDAIDNANGNKQSAVGALLDRINQDTNTVTPTYYTAPALTVGLEPPGRTYYGVDPPGAPSTPPRGNGRRIVTMPINDPTTDLVSGFAQFFLPLNPCPNLGGGAQPCCGEYIGPASLLPGDGGAPNGSGSLGAYRIALFQ